MDITKIIRIVSLSYGKAPYGLIMQNVNPNDAEELRMNMLDILRKVESGEYVKVVRCKDCKNKGKVFCPRLYASSWGNNGEYIRYENSCSFGERG